MSAEASPSTRPRRMIWMAAGFIIWSSAFVLLYALHALVCAWGWPAGAIRALLWGVLLAHLGALLLAGRAFQRARREDAPPEGAFIDFVSLWGLYAAFAATLLSLGPPLLLSVCL